ncbi:type II toxin-antitoxin system HicB family antitoxin [Patescibacteria group bacterium]|nr:type II toxin-antitoxin system HicB family antitoxin [Patescibacteria group bacterium]MCL5091939.1 type II toxin-antitoxin system HicB family antitoxin [Patescibacteria group bacterium]
MSIRFPITIKVLCEPEAKDAPYVAYIPEFDISSCGKTEEKAKENAKQALEITLEEIKKQGKLNEFLKEAGFSPQSRSLFPKITFEPFVFRT